MVGLIYWQYYSVGIEDNLLPRHNSKQLLNAQLYNYDFSQAKAKQNRDRW